MTLIDIIMIVLDGLVLLAIYLLKHWIGSNTARSLEKYKIEQQQYINVLFRDENVRPSVVPNIIATGDKEKMRIYKRVCDLYYKVLQVTNERNDKQNEITDKLWDEINDLRSDFFINSMYLGTLEDPLFKAIYEISEDLRANGSKNRGGHNSVNSTNELINAKNWIAKNMRPHLTLNNVDYPEEIIKKSHEQCIAFSQKQLETHAKEVVA